MSNIYTAVPEVADGLEDVLVYTNEACPHERVMSIYVST